MADVLDHYRAGEDAPVEPGVYRVVGAGDDAVTLLRVAEDGSRVHGGVVVQVARDDLDALEPASNPDAGLGRLRQVPKKLAGHPVVSAGALGLLVTGGYLAATASGLAEDVGAAALAVGLAGLWILAR